jgi:hypothetical protein
MSIGKLEYRMNQHASYTAVAMPGEKVIQNLCEDPDLRRFCSAGL